MVLLTNHWAFALTISGDAGKAIKVVQYIPFIP
jgi:hypothetical protein